MIKLFHLLEKDYTFIGIQLIATYENNSANYPLLIYKSSDLDDSSSSDKNIPLQNFRTERQNSISSNVTFFDEDEEEFNSLSLQRRVFFSITPDEVVKPITLELIPIN